MKCKDIIIYCHKRGKCRYYLSSSGPDRGKRAGWMPLARKKASRILDIIPYCG